MQFARVPVPLLSVLLEEFDDLEELKLILRSVWMLSQNPSEWRALTVASLCADRTVATMLKATGDELERKVRTGLDSLAKRGVLISCKTESGTEYLLNTAESRNAVTRMGRKRNPLPAPETVQSHEPPNYGGIAWRFYEENIGTITPAAAENISAALATHSESDVVEAIRKSVNANARNWNYVSAILKRWEEYGKDGKSAGISEKNTDVFISQYLERQRARGNY